MKIGYATVSTKHQRDSLDQQITLLKRAGFKKIYFEIISGTKLKRSELAKLSCQVSGF